MKKEKKPLKKSTKVFLRTLTGSVVGAMAAVGAFMVTPNKTIIVHFDENQFKIDEGSLTDETHLSKFIAHLSNAVSTESEENIPGVKLSFEDFSITWGSYEDGEETKLKNNLEIEGDIMLGMQNIDDLQFTAELGVNYNSKSIDLGIGYVNRDLYIALQDLRLKSSHTNADEISEKIYNLFFNEENEEGLGMIVDIDGMINTLIGKVDISSLMDMFKPEDEEVQIGFDLYEEANGEGKTNVHIDVFKQDATSGEKIDNGDIVNIVMSLFDDEEGITHLDYIDLGTITFGDATIKGKINCDSVSNFKLYGFDQPEYLAQGGRSYGEFVEMIDYIGWADKLLDFLKERKLGLSLNADISRGDNSLIAGINANVDVDVSQLFDLSGKIFDAEFIDSITAEKDPNEPAKTTKEIVDEVLGKVAFGLDVNVSGDEKEEEQYVRKQYANLGVHFKDNTGYVTLNENEDGAVMKAAVTVESLNKLLEKLPEAVEDTTKGEVNEEQTSSLFSFITKSELVTAIKDGRYDGIIDLLESLESRNGQIIATINLKPLGFGNDSNLVLTLDSSLEADHKVLDLEINNAKIGDNAYLNATLATKDFSDERINSVVADADSYDNLNHLASVYDQVSAILDTKQAGFKITGSVKEANGVGLDISGWGQFDYGTKYGFGSLSFDQYALKNNKLTKKFTHLVNIDVDNRQYLDEKAEVKVENPNKNAYFSYGEHQGIKGYMEIDSISQLMDVLKTFLNENIDNPRFSKFIKPLMETLGMDYFGTIIEDKNYIKMIGSELIKEIKEYDNGSYVNIRLNGDLFSLTEDIQIRLNYAGIGENRTLASLELPSLAYEDKTIILKVELMDFDENKVSPVDFSNKNDFLNFSSIKTLLHFGLNTTLQGYYLIDATINVSIGSALTALKVVLKGHIEVNGKNTKVYIVCDKLPTNLLVTNDSVSCTTTSELVFEPDQAASGNDIGGYFHILRTEKHTSIFNRKTEKYYYRSTSKNFVDSENNATNLLRYLLVDFLNIYETEVNLIVNAINDGGQDDKDINYENMLSGDRYKYSKSSNGLTHTWKLGINLEALTGVSVLETLNVAITGKQANADAKGYLTNLTADTKILSIFKLSANITLSNAGSTAQNWTSAAQTAYNNVINVFYNTISSNSSKLSTFLNNYQNNPLAHYKL